MNHHQTDDGTEEKVAAENARRTDCDDDGQECESSVGDEVKESIPVGIREARDSMAECLDNAHHQTGCDDGRKNRDEDVTDRLEHASPDRSLGCSGSLYIVLGCCCKTGDGKKFIVNLVDGAGSDDDLELAVRLERSLDAINVFNCLLINLAVICDDQSESCRAVCRTDEVFLAAEQRDQLFSALPVIECHDWLPLSLKLRWYFLDASCCLLMNAC